jgi:poly(3-hydroxybutyrate) depolymerase
LSAGGAAAANLASAFPDSLAGVCVHSGLPAGAARDLPGALAAMRSGAGAAQGNEKPVPMLIIHGDADSTVSPSNADGLKRQALGSARTTLRSGGTESAGGRKAERSVDALPDGTVLCERITVRGGGHAWFGGDPAGSHTDASGPDSSAEIVRFFGLAR